MSEQQVAPATPPSPSENNVVAFNSREQVARVVVATKSSSFASRGSSTASKKKRVSGESSSDTAAFAGLAPATKHARPAEQLPATPVTLGQLSDSSDSNNGNSAKIPFVNTAECTMAHDGQQMVNVILPVNIDILFKTLYTNSKFLEDFHESRKITDAVHTEWTDANTPAGTLRHRSFRCKIPFKKAMGFTMVSEVIFNEELTLSDCSVDGCLYSINRLGSNEGIPYGDTFDIHVHHCLVRTIDDHTMLSVYVSVKFKKYVFPVIRNLIEKTTLSGTEEFYQAWLATLQSHFCTPPAKGIKRHVRSKKNATAATQNDCDSSKTTLLPLEIEVGGGSQLVGGGGNNNHKSSSLRRNAAQLMKSSAEASSAATVATMQSSLSASVMDEIKSKHITDDGIDLLTNRKRLTMWLVLSVMICITLLNFGLYARLISLQYDDENAVAMFAFRPEDWDISPDEMRSDQEWMDLFQRRESFHNQRIQQIRHKLNASIKSLQQIEKYLTELVVVLQIGSKNPNEDVTAAATNQP